MSEPPGEPGPLSAEVLAHYASGYEAQRLVRGGQRRLELLGPRSWSRAICRRRPP